MTSKTNFFNISLITIITILCLLPFADKAVHMDDTLFLWNAQQIQAHPLDFYGFSINWYGFEMPMSQVTKNPPLTSYFIALITMLFGWKELVLHLAFLLPAVATALGVYTLAKRLCDNPLLATLIGIVSPLFLVSSSTLMCDTMMLAFYVWAIVLWLKGLDQLPNLERAGGLLLSSAVLIGLCGLTKYFGVTLLPLLVVYSSMQLKKIGGWTLALIIPIAMWTIYQLGTEAYYGKGLLLDAASYAGEQQSVGGDSFMAKLITTLSFAGGGLIGALFFLPALWAKRGVFVVGAIVGIALVVGHFTRSWFYTQLIIFSSTGLIILLLSLHDLYKKRDAEASLLFLWLIGTFCFTGFTNWTVNSRSLLPLVPIVGILIVRNANQAKISLSKYWPLVPALILALSVTLSDTSLANSARGVVQEISIISQTEQAKVWFQGHWGFQYYMQKAGFAPLDRKHPQLTKGDLIVIPHNNTNTVAMPADLVEYVQTITIPLTPSGIATHQKKLNAGFYSSLWGQLPFAFGQVGAEEYTVLRVKRDFP